MELSPSKCAEHDSLKYLLSGEKQKHGMYMMCQKEGDLFVFPSKIARLLYLAGGGKLSPFHSNMVSFPVVAAGIPFVIVSASGARNGFICFAV